jgi:hypothetical protein
MNHAISAERFLALEARVRDHTISAERVLALEARVRELERRAGVGASAATPLEPAEEALKPPTAPDDDDGGGGAEDAVAMSKVLTQFSTKALTWLHRGSVFCYVCFQVRDLNKMDIGDDQTGRCADSDGVMCAARAAAYPQCGAEAGHAKAVSRLSVVAAEYGRSGGTCNAGVLGKHLGVKRCQAFMESYSHVRDTAAASQGAAVLAANVAKQTARLGSSSSGGSSNSGGGNSSNGGGGSSSSGGRNPAAAHRNRANSRAGELFCQSALMATSAAALRDDCSISKLALQRLVALQSAVDDEDLVVVGDEAWPGGVCSDGCHRTVRSIAGNGGWSHLVDVSIAGAAFAGDCLIPALERRSSGAGAVTAELAPVDESIVCAAVMAKTVQPRCSHAHNTLDRRTNVQAETLAAVRSAVRACPSEWHDTGGGREKLLALFNIQLKGNVLWGTQGWCGATRGDDSNSAGSDIATEPETAVHGTKRGHVECG